MSTVSTPNKDLTLLHPPKTITILTVEDDPISMCFLESQINELGNTSVRAENGSVALQKLQADPSLYDVIIMDREMPVMNGITAVQKIKHNPLLKHIPIIMVTGADTDQELEEGLDSGVFYYLTKPVKPNMLRSVLSAAIRESQQSKVLADELGKHRASFNLIETCKFKFRMLSEAESLAAFMANCFPDPYRVLPGLGALLTNAVEHGILGIGYDKKNKMIDTGIWRAEVQRLSSHPNNSEKYASATIAHKDNGLYVVVEDCGQGFDWQKFLKIDPSRAGDNNGRGIAQANTISFDKLTYNEKGNQAVAFVGQSNAVDW